MSRPRRWPLAVTCIGLGLALGLAANSRLVGQPAPAPNPPPLPVEPFSFSPVVKRVLPAVVSIEGKAKAAAKAGTAPTDEQDFGSGVLIDPTGVVLTNNHVVEGALEVEVLLADGRKVLSRDIRRDPKSDLAVIKLDGKDPFPFLEIGDSDAVEVGDRVLAFGSPFGLTGSVSHGIVSGKSRNNLRLNQYEDFLQTDAAVNPGSSGGPLVALDGKVVGITAAIKTRSGGFSGVGLAVAGNLARTVASDLVKHGAVRRGYLGIKAADLTDAQARPLGLPANGGAVVTAVQPDSPAAQAGLLVGDVATTFAGRPVTDARALQRMVTAATPGAVVEVNVIRGGKPLAVHATVVSQPAEFGSAPATTPPAVVVPPAGPTPGMVPLQDLGLAVSDVSAETAARLGYPANTRGALIVAVTRESRADRAGLRAGSVVVRVDRTPVGSAAAFRQAIAQASRDRGAVLQVLRPTGETEFAVLRLP